MGDRRFGASIPRGSGPRPFREVEVIIPSFTGAERLPALLGSVQAQLTAVTDDAAIVVVDDGTVDRRIESALRSSGDAPIYLLRCGEMGKGPAVRRGMLTSNASVVAFQDADLLTPSDALDQALAALAGGADLAMAIRRRDGSCGDTGTGAGSGPDHASTCRSDGEVGPSLFGFGCFRGMAARSIFNRDLGDGSGFDVEVLSRARRQGSSIAVLPGRWAPA